MKLHLLSSHVRRLNSQRSEANQPEPRTPLDLQCTCAVKCPGQISAPAFYPHPTRINRSHPWSHRGATVEPKVADPRRGPPPHSTTRGKSTWSRRPCGFLIPCAGVPGATAQTAGVNLMLVWRQYRQSYPTETFDRPIFLQRVFPIEFLSGCENPPAPE